MVYESFMISDAYGVGDGVESQLARLDQPKLISIVKRDLDSCFNEIMAIKQKIETWSDQVHERERLVDPSNMTGQTILHRSLPLRCAFKICRTQQHLRCRHYACAAGVGTCSDTWAARGTVCPPLSAPPTSLGA